MLLFLPITATAASAALFPHFQCLFSMFRLVCLCVVHSTTLHILEFSAFNVYLIFCWCTRAQTKALIIPFSLLFHRTNRNDIVRTTTTNAIWLDHWARPRLWNWQISIAQNPFAASALCIHLSSCLYVNAVCAHINMRSHVSSNCPFQLIPFCHFTSFHILRCAVSLTFYKYLHLTHTGTDAHMELAAPISANTFFPLNP